MRIANAAVMVALLGASVACSRSRVTNTRAAETSGAPVAVSVARSEKRDLVDSIDLTGTLTPDEQVTVYAKIPGYLKSIHFDIGDRVQEGQRIAELEVPEMTTQLAEKRAALMKAQAALEQARVAVEQTQAEAEFAQVNYKRLKNIHDRDADVLPAQDVDQARSSLGVANGKLHNAQAQIRVAEAAVSAAQAEIDTLNTLMTYARIEAPLAGVVTERFVDRGALIQAAAASRTQAAPVVTIARIDHVRALIDVPEPSAPYIHTGTGVMLQVESLPGHSFPARVARIAGVLDPSSRTLRAEIDIPNPDERLRAGMTVRVSLELRRLPGAVTVPVAAVQGSERSVFLVKDGRARRIKVKTGLESPEWIQIADGLKAGEEVVVASSAPLEDGSPVSVRP